jgi:hypothetical protein
MAAVLADRGILATAPSRQLNRRGVSLAARWYYDVWERLPQVRSGLFGRGVIALSPDGFERVASLPRFLSDDLAYSESFSEQERAITADATVTVWPARTWRALISRRVRVIRGIHELRRAGRVSDSASTSIANLIDIVRHEPTMVFRIPLFVLTTLVARVRERTTRSGSAVWQRDETSRVA